MKAIQNNRVNNQILAPELRVLDDAGENLGVMTKEAALQLAKEKGLDLIEISASAKPPVARIMSFDKYRYQEEKKLKKQRVAEKTSGMKQIQIGVGTAENDLRIKVQKVNEFMNEGCRVEIMLVMRGREKAHKDFALERLKNFMKMIDPQHKVLLSPRLGGRGFIAHVSK